MISINSSKEGSTSPATTSRYKLLQDHVRTLQQLSEKSSSSSSSNSQPIQQRIILQHYKDAIQQSNDCKWWNDAQELHTLLNGVLETVDNELPPRIKTGKLIRYCSEYMSEQVLDRLDSMNKRQILDICRQDLILRTLRQRTNYRSENPQTQTPQSAIMKVIVVGPLYAGKSSCIQKYVRNEFHSVYRATIGVDFFLKKLVDYRRKIPHSQNMQQVNIHLWDIAGQERFNIMTRSFYQGAIGAIVVADCTSQQSIQEAVRWKQDIDEKVRVHNSDTGEDIPVPCIFFLNKVDLLSDVDGNEDPVVPEQLTQQMDEICSRHGFLCWMDTSAKTGRNIENGILTLVDHIFDSGLMELPKSPTNVEVVHLSGSGSKSLTYMNERGEILDCRSDGSEDYSDYDHVRDDGFTMRNLRSRCCG